MARRIVICLTLVASLVVALAADAGARVHRLHPMPPAMKKAVRKAAVPEPQITSVSPLALKVGQKLKIKGKHFSAKHTKVYFLRFDGGAVIVKADSATKRHLVVTVPDTIVPLLKQSGAILQPTRFKLRILTTRYGPIASKKLAPTISPNDSSEPNPKPKCPVGGSSDSDFDGLTDATETSIKTNPCKADTDTDGLPDGYEYQSALDMNNTTPFGTPDAARPYPGKTPWPNPLDKEDANIDHDGDGMTMALEYQLNKFAGGPKTGDLQYSDGQQRSRFQAAPVDPVLDYFDVTHFPSFNDGVLSDDERDADNDGLPNWDEASGRMTQDWWDKEYNQEGDYHEKRYPREFPKVSAFDDDSDGDGIKDGADDQDFDGLSNAFEISRPWDWPLTYVSTGHAGATHAAHPEFYEDNLPIAGPLPVGVGPNPWARVQPFDPCKPVASETCMVRIPFGYYPKEQDPIGPDPTFIGSAPSAPWLFDAADHPLANGE
jgi:Bacterial TSP3 repeat